MKQYFFETGTNQIRTSVKRLRKFGYNICVSRLDKQKTNSGYKMTMISVMNSDEKEKDYIIGNIKGVI